LRVPLLSSSLHELLHDRWRARGGLAGRERYHQRAALSQRLPALPASRPCNRLRRLVCAPFPFGLESSGWTPPSMCCAMPSLTCGALLPPTCGGSLPPTRDGLLSSLYDELLSSVCGALPSSMSLSMMCRASPSSILYVMSFLP
jgi:hypothetical protein